jgi:hypothetical protein
VQAAELQHDQEQEEDDGAAGVQQVLSLLPEAHRAQRDEIIADRKLQIAIASRTSELPICNLQFAMHLGQ